MSIRVLVVHESASLRKSIVEGLARHKHIEVIGSAGTYEVAWTRLHRLNPQVIVLDLDIESGLPFLHRVVAERPTPIVAVMNARADGAATSSPILSAGARSVAFAPSFRGDDEMTAFLANLSHKVEKAARSAAARAQTRKDAAVPDPDPEPQVAQPSKPDAALARPGRTRCPDVIAIGTSTGGASALNQILPTFPASAPPIVVVDHMPQGYTKALADRLDKACSMDVCEAQDGERLRRGIIRIAPGGDRHLRVVRVGGELQVRLEGGTPTDGHCPSVTELFLSVARSVGRDGAAALLTGMGRDGADGLLAIRRVGGFTVTQDERTSVVYGMPKAAYELGASNQQAALNDIPDYLLGRR